MSNNAKTIKSKRQQQQQQNSTTTTKNTSPEFLQRRRAQIASASRRIRDRRKEEVKTLKEENEQLHSERQLLQIRLERLSKQVELAPPLPTPDPVLVAENELLKAQIRQYDLFVRSVI